MCSIKKLPPLSPRTSCGSPENTLQPHAPPRSLASSATAPSESYKPSETANWPSGWSCRRRCAFIPCFTCRSWNLIGKTASLGEYSHPHLPLRLTMKWNEKWRKFWTLAFNTRSSSTSFIGKAMDPTNAPGNPPHTSRTQPKASPPFTNVIPTARQKTSQSALRRVAVADPRLLGGTLSLLGEGCTVMNACHEWEI